MSNNLQKASFVKSCMDNSGDLRCSDELNLGTEQAKCKKWLGRSPSGGP